VQVDAAIWHRRRHELRRLSEVGARALTARGFLGRLVLTYNMSIRFS